MGSHPSNGIHVFSESINLFAALYCRHQQGRRAVRRLQKLHPLTRHGTRGPLALLFEMFLRCLQNTRDILYHQVNQVRLLMMWGLQSIKSNVTSQDDLQEDRFRERETIHFAEVGRQEISRRNGSSYGFSENAKTFLIRQLAEGAAALDAHRTQPSLCFLNGFCKPSSEQEVEVVVHHQPLRI